jgi:hypothetical protein
MTLPPIEEELKALDSLQAKADRHRHAEKLSDTGEHLVDRLELAAALDPRRRLGPVSTASEKAHAERQATSNVKALIVRQIEAQLRHADERAVYFHPDRQEEQRIWSAYLNQVSMVGWSQGNKSDAWVARWQKLIRQRNAAQEYDESTLSIDGQLEKMVGVPYPKLPDAAWEAADCLSENEREAEYKRLEKKYGPRKPPSEARHRGRNQPK